MKITHNMALGQLAEHMGSSASTGEAQKFLNILVRRGWTGRDIADLSEVEWLRAMDDMEWEGRE